jgi:hypothetical protein
MAALPSAFNFTVDIHVVVLQPPPCRNKVGLGFFLFARHYLGNHYCFLFLCLLRCFSSAGLRICDWPSASQVSPFGNLRIDSYVPIPAAYRSLSRPSSPLRAKASPVCPYLLSSRHGFIRAACSMHCCICCLLFQKLLPICQRTVSLPMASCRRLPSVENIVSPSGVDRWRITESNR